MSKCLGFEVSWVRSVLGPKCPYTGATVLTGFTAQFADKPTRSQSRRKLVKSRANQIGNSKFLKNHGKSTLYWYTKLNPIEY